MNTDDVQSGTSSYGMAHFQFCCFIIPAIRLSLLGYKESLLRHPLIACYTLMNTVVRRKASKLTDIADDSRIRARRLSVIIKP